MYKRSTGRILLAFLVAIFTASTAAEPAKPLVGRVVDESDQPLPGAKVAVIGGKDGCDTLQELTATTTGPDGRFAFKAQIRNKDGIILATKAGKCLDWAYLGLVRDSDLSLRLGPAAVIEGTIVDEAGKPIPGVAVNASVEPQTPYLSRSLSDGILNTRSDSQGHFRFSNLPSGAKVGFDMTAPGYARALYVGVHGEGLFVPGQTGLRFVLPPEGRLEGVVVEKGTARPLADVWVQAWGSVTSGQQTAKAKTDKDGHFRIGGLSGGKYNLEIVGFDETTLPEWVVLKEKRDESYPLHAQRAHVKAGKSTTGVKVEAIKGGTLEIVLTDTTTDKAIQANNACVTVCPASDLRISNWSFAQRDGRARLCLPPDKYVVTAVEASGYRYGEEKSRPFQVEMNKTNRVTIAVKPVPQKVMGTVRDFLGQAVPHAKVHIIPMIGPPKDVIAGDDGRFAIDSADMAPLACFLLVRHPKLNLIALGFAATGEQPPDITLQSPTKVSGIVLDSKRRPVVEANVLVQIDASHMGRYGIVATTRTNKDGRYQLELAGATITSYAISARASGYSVGILVVGPNELAPAFVVPDGVAQEPEKKPEMAALKTLGALSQLISKQKTVEVKELVLKAADRVVRGVVKDERGHLVPGAIIAATPSERPQFPDSAVTDDKGRFTLQHLDDSSSIYVFARVPGRGWGGDVCPRPGETDVVITVATPYWD